MSCAAFDALSLFDPSGFKLIHLPKEVYCLMFCIRVIYKYTIDRY